MYSYSDMLSELGYLVVTYFLRFANWFLELNVTNMLAISMFLAIALSVLLSFLLKILYYIMCCRCFCNRQLQRREGFVLSDSAQSRNNTYRSVYEHKEQDQDNISSWMRRRVQRIDSEEPEESRNKWFDPLPRNGYLTLSERSKWMSLANTRTDAEVEGVVLAEAEAVSMQPSAPPFSDQSFETTKM